MNKNHEEVFHFSIIIENYYRQSHLYYLWNSNLNSIYDSLFLSHWPFLFQHIDFCLFLYLFMNEFCIFSHLGFTYTTRITVKSESHII